MLAPTVDGLAGEFAGKVKVLKVDVREEPEIAEAYGIADVPALVLVHKGREIGRQAEPHPESLSRWVKESLGLN